MEIACILGELKDGRTALVLDKGNRIEFCLARGFDDSRPMGSKWDSGEYIYNLETFINIISKIQDTEMYRKSKILDDYVHYVEIEDMQSFGDIEGLYPDEELEGNL